MKTLIATCIEELPRMSLDDRILTVTDIFVLAFQTRNCRGGKGEKDLFYDFALVLFKDFPDTVLNCLPLIAKYGSYKDYFRILDKTSDSGEEHGRIRERIVEIVASTIERDLSRLACLEAAVPCAAACDSEAECAATTQSSELSEGTSGEDASEAEEGLAHTGRGGGNGKVSLCAKYVPREGSRLAKGEGNKEWLRALRNRLFPHAEGPASKKLLRQAISKLTAALDVPEVKMCAKRYREIDFSSVPSLCLNRNRRAFANDLVDNEHTGRNKKAKAKAKAMAAAKLSREEREERGDRFPEDEDRVQCRGALKRALVEGGVNGKQLHPHEIVRQIRKGQGSGGKGLTSLDDLLLGVQWAKVRDGLVAKLEAAKEPQPITDAPTPSGGAAERGAGDAVAMDFRKLVPLVDVSGSMEGDPMDAAIALGILTSEVNHPLFRDRFITFESSPRWVDLAEAPSVVEKVRVAAAAPWGGSTNMEAAFGLICEAVLRARLPVEEVPDLIVFSDMQFDQACEGSRHPLTQLQRVQRMFHDVGLAICGRPYPAPRLVFWNLRGGPTGYPAQAHSENVQMLSGFSPSLLELALSGAPISAAGAAGAGADAAGAGAAVDGDEDEEGGGGGAVTRAKVTPYETFRRAMDSGAYDAVRAVLARSREEVLLRCSDAGGDPDPDPDPAVSQLAEGMGCARVSD